MMCSLGYKTNEACSESSQVLRGEKEKQSKKKNPVVTSETERQFWKRQVSGQRCLRNTH